ncbi:MAG: hypothetical protein ACLSGS_03045 [Adlercreutzia sp.]
MARRRAGQAEGRIDHRSAGGEHNNLEEYTLERVSEITEVPADKIEEAVRTYTTRLNPLHGNGGIHYQLAPDQTGHAVQNTRALQLIACLTGNSDEPAGNRGSSKAQVDGCCGRANMIVTDHDPVDWGIREGIGTMELGNTPRDLSVEDQIPLIQNFVKYLQDENSPLMERYGNHIPTDEEARIIAMRKGGDYKGSRSFPGLKTPFENNADQISAERFPLLRFWNSWTDASSIWDAIREIDSPYKLYGGICMSGDFMNQSNLLEAWDALTQLDFWVDINLWSCPNNGTADYVFPCTHWLETNTGRVSQGAGGIFGAGQRCVEPIGDVVFDPTFVVCLHKSMGVPFNDRDPEYDEWLNLDYHDFIQAGGSVGYEEQEYRVLKDATDWWKTEEYPDGPDFPQYAAKFQEEGWFDCRKWHPERWGTYRRWEMGYRRQQAGYNLYAAVDEKCAFGTPTGKVEIWSTICESYIGDTVTESYVLETPGTAAKVGDKTPYFAQVCSPDRDAYAGDIPDIDKFPHWFEPKNSRVQAPEWYDANLVDGASYNSDNYLNKPYHGIAGVGKGQATDNGTTDNLEAYKQAVKENPEATFICTSGARQPVYFHSEHRQLPAPRAGRLRAEMNPNDARPHRAGATGSHPWGAIREVDCTTASRKAPPTPTMPGGTPRCTTPPTASSCRHQLHHGQVRPVLDQWRPSCAATRWSSTRPPRRTRRSATRAVRPVGQRGHHQRQRPAPEGMAGQRPAPERLQGGAHLRERRCEGPADDQPHQGIGRRKHDVQLRNHHGSQPLHGLPRLHRGVQGHQRRGRGQLLD